MTNSESPTDPNWTPGDPVNEDPLPIIPDYTSLGDEPQPRSSEESLDFEDRVRGNPLCEVFRPIFATEADLLSFFQTLITTFQSGSDGISLAVATLENMYQNIASSENDQPQELGSDELIIRYLNALVMSEEMIHTDDQQQRSRASGNTNLPWQMRDYLTSVDPAEEYIDQDAKRLKTLGYSKAEIDSLIKCKISSRQAADYPQLAQAVIEADPRIQANRGSWLVRISNIVAMARAMNMHGVSFESRHELIPYLPGGIDTNDLERFFDHFNETDFIMVYLHFRHSPDLDPEEDPEVNELFFQNYLGDFFRQKPQHQFELVHQLRSGQTWKNRAKYLEFLRQIKESYGLATTLTQQTLANIDAGESEVWARHIDVSIGTELEHRKTALPIRNLVFLLEKLANIPRKIAGLSDSEISPPPCWNPHTLITLYNLLYDLNFIDQYPTTAHDNLGLIESLKFFHLSVLFKQMAGYSLVPEYYEPEPQKRAESLAFKVRKKEPEVFPFSHRFESKEPRNFHPDHFAKHIVLGARLASAQYAYEQVLKKFFGLKFMGESLSYKVHFWDGSIRGSNRYKAMFLDNSEDPDGCELIGPMPILTHQQIETSQLKPEVQELAMIYADFLTELKSILHDNGLDELVFPSMEISELTQLYQLVAEVYGSVEDHYNPDALAAVDDDHIVARSQQLGEEVVTRVEAVRDKLYLKFLGYLQVIDDIIGQEPEPNDETYQNWLRRFVKQLKELEQAFPDLGVIFDFSQPPEGLKQAVQFLIVKYLGS